jgi:hypothetical protein
VLKIGISDDLGFKGIFICDKCVGNMNLDNNQKEKLKEYVGNHTTSDLLKCHLCNTHFNLSDGTFIPPDIMADAIESNITNIEDMYTKTNSGEITCTKCGKTTKTTEKRYLCECGTEIKVKDELKKYDMGFVKKNAMKIYVKTLRKGGNVWGVKK